MLPAFRFEEKMAGRYHLLAEPGAERAIDFTLTARSGGLASFLRRPEVQVEGEANLEGFADHKPAHGTMLIDLLVGRRIRYDFEFRANDGNTYRFTGQKDVDVARLVDTMSTLPAGLLDGSGKRVGEALVRFHYSTDLFRFLRSWRLV